MSGAHGCGSARRPTGVEKTVDQLNKRRYQQRKDLFRMGIGLLFAGCFLQMIDLMLG